MSDTNESSMVQLRQIVRTFGEGNTRVHALKGIDLDLLEGEYVAIRGSSGSGKSTLLQIIGCLDAPTDGEYLLRGRDVRLLSDVDLARIRNEEIGFVFQSYHLLPDRSAEENVRLPLDYRRCRDEPHDPRQMLERVGLGDRSSHRPGELSGGERQRVAIARALVKRPRLIIFDEPTGNLDQRTTAEILDLLDELHCEENATLLLVTHDEKVADRADRELLIEDGRWVR